MWDSTLPTKSAAWCWCCLQGLRSPAQVISCRWRVCARSEFPRVYSGNFLAASREAWQCGCWLCSGIIFKLFPSWMYMICGMRLTIAEGSQVNYAFMLLTGAINPLLMGYGLWQRRWWMLACGVGGQLLVYSIGGTKGSILSIPFILGFYLLFRVRFFLFAHKLMFGILTLVGGLCLSWRIVDGDPGPIHVLVLFVVLMRTLSMEGLLTSQYHYFFQHNPFTYYSHIKGVNLLVHYPYQFSLGQEIGVAFAGTTDMNANAHFWATDGIGGMGLPGLLLVSLICALVFWILDSAAQQHDPRLSALIISFSAFNLANLSIFTTFLSGGLGLLILLLHLLQSRDQMEYA